MTIKQMKRLVILDNYEDSEFKNDIKAYLSNSNKGISIPSLIVRWRKDFIKEYLGMIYSIGFNKNSLINTHEDLLIRKNFSFWWMTLLAEKSPIRSKSIYKILQYRTIERLFYKKKCTHLILCSENEDLHELLLEWSKNSCFSYERKKKEHRNTSEISINALYQRLPSLIKALILLVRFIFNKNKFLGRSNKMKLGGFKDSKLAKRLIICPFPGIDEKMAAKGIFRSNYWGDAQALIESGVNINFLFMYTPTLDCKNANEAIEKRDLLQKKSNGRHNYYFLEEFISISSIFRIIQDYFFLYYKSFNQEFIKKNSFLEGSSTSFWKLLKPEWHSSTRGVVAMDGCIKIKLFEESLKSFKDSNDGFYLVENQPWERVLNYLWKDLFNTPLIGVQNNPFRPFDLRFYEDQRIYNTQHKSSFPMPSLLLTNGKYSQENILEFGYPKEAIKFVEAYKYSYLIDQQKYHNNLDSKSKENTLLVIVDGLPIFANKQLKLLGKFLSSNENDHLNIVIKPHPFCDVSSYLNRYLKNVNFKITNDSLNSLWQSSTIVYASNMTSSGLESLFIGIPTIIYLDYNSINLSPALDFEGAMFASNSDDFKSFMELPSYPKPKNDYLCLDKNLTRWKDLLLSNYN
jgi:surface carbohydrate biosynthesis protein (TIGR04326 family)